ncbi:MAG: DUF6602 domain-containing protein [Oculatellaceae cyanobacterium bins.114]|nr:DUF6602 domain-containing protein [Oculatellaceae cyanobacterium bins.114]
MLNIWLDYVERLASILQAEGKKAEILQHMGNRGSARESFILKFLQDFLPETVGIGTGEIFDRGGRRSKQIDIVIYDRAFPIPKIGIDQWLFPIEAVIATIEVKSELNSSELRRALDNCMSVVKLRPRAGLVNPQVVTDSNIKISDYTPSAEDFDWMYPGTYVVGYSGYKDPTALIQIIHDWFISDTQKLAEVPNPLMALPRVIATPTALFLRKMDNLKLNSADGQTQDCAACVSSKSMNVFVADLLSKILRRTMSIRTDVLTQKQWILLTVEDFDLIEVLEPDIQWQTVKFEYS